MPNKFDHSHALHNGLVINESVYPQTAHDPNSGNHAFVYMMTPDETRLALAIEAIESAFINGTDLKDSIKRAAAIVQSVRTGQDENELVEKVADMVTQKSRLAGFAATLKIQNTRAFMR